MSIPFFGKEALKPSRSRIARQDLAKKFPEIDINCGFEFFVPYNEGKPGEEVIEILVRNPDGFEHILKAEVDASTKLLPAAVVLRGITVNAADQSIVAQGQLEGDATKFSFVHATLNGSVLANAALTLGPEVTPAADARGALPRRSFTLRAPSALSLDGELYQIFPATGDTLRVAFRMPRQDYLLSAEAAIAPEHQFAAVGAIHQVRASSGNGLVEIRGAFLGSYGAARVELEIDNRKQSRPARLEAGPVSVPGELTRAFDTAFSDWTWCDELPLAGIRDKTVRARIVSGDRVLGLAEMKVRPDAVEMVAEALEPSYFVSPLDGYFSRLVELASQPSLDPVVHIVFPGDLFRTFGGGPARVVEMARYLGGMGYAVSIIDIAEEAEGFDTLPPEHAGTFRSRLGLPKAMLEEFTRLALDHMMREAGTEHTREALVQALEERDEPPADVILRRTNARFNALAAFFVALAKPDFLICNFAWTAAVFDAVPATVCKILDVHDIQHHRGLVHQAITGDDSYMASLDIELEAIRKADYVLAIQEDDKDFIIESSGRNNVVFCSHAKPIVETPSVGDDTHRLLFIGNRYPPNTVGLRNFIEQSWPLIRARVPDAELLVVGSVAQDFDTVPEGITLLGKVADLDPVYADVALVINPVEFGSGLNIKSVEALCHGRCLVTTDFGLRGLTATEEEVHRVPAAEMPEAITGLLLDPERRRRLERGAMAFARRSLTADRIFRELFNTMELRLYS